MQISSVKIPGDTTTIRADEPHVLIEQDDDYDEYYGQAVAIPLSYLPTLIQKLKEISDANS